MTKEFYNTEYEKVILGMMLIDNTLIDIIRGKLTKECFYESGSKFLFTKICEQWDLNKCVNLLTLSSSAPNFDPALLADLTNVSSTSNWEFYVNKIKQLYLARSFKTELSTAVQDINPEKINDSIGDLQTKLTSFMQYGSDSADMKNLCITIPEEIEAASKLNKKYLGYETGYEQLDDILDGFQDGQTYVIGARPSIGKTAFALSIARRLCQHGASVDVFSYEMSANQDFYRMLASESKLPMWQLKKGDCCKYKTGINKLHVGLERLFSYDMNIIDRGCSTDEELYARIRYEAVVKGKKVFIIDHLGLIQLANPSTQHYLDVGKITSTLHRMAKELNICIIMLCQMNREAEGKKPDLSNIRESGNIEQDGDVIILLYRERDLEEDEIPTQAIIQKNRDGKTGYANFIFNKPIQDFVIDNGQYKNDETEEAPAVPVERKSYAEEELPF